LPRVLFALATSHKIGLALAAALFVVFAVISALWLPRLRPDFPGPKLKVFLAVCVLITLVMLGAVIALAKEPKEKEAAAAETSATVTATATGPAATTTAAPTPTANPANGKAIFAAQGCAACHTFTPAGSKATIGPDLDHLAADTQKANRGSVAAYTKESIVDPNAYVVPKFPKGVMPQDFGTKLSPSQLNDLIAFLTQK
jgi:mono/diheme cytochrome c family protein